MKKIILILLVLSMLFSFCSCKADSDIENIPSKAVPSDNQDNSFSASGSPSNSSGSNGAQGCMVDHPSFRTLEEFNHYVATNTLPMSFVTYQDIAALGEFESLIEISKGKEYLYSLDIGTEKSLALYVYYNHTLQQFYDSINVDLSVDTMESFPSSDLRYGGIAGHPYKQNDFYYSYSTNGKLISITWESNGVVFALGSSGELAAYNGDNVILNMLLTKGDESAQIKAAFDTMIQNKLNQAKQ